MRTEPEIVDVGVECTVEQLGSIYSGEDEIRLDEGMRVIEWVLGLREELPELNEGQKILLLYKS